MKLIRKTGASDDGKPAKGEKVNPAVPKPAMISTISDLLAQDTWSTIVFNRLSNYMGTEKYLEFGGLVNIFELHQKFLTKNHELAIKFCMLIKIRGKKLSKYVREDAAKQVLREMAQAFDLQLHLQDTKGNKPDAVCQALCPIMMAVCMILEQSYTEKITIKGKTPYKGKLNVELRWSGSLCAVTQTGAVAVIPEWENWSQLYIADRRRDKALTPKQIAGAIVSRAADRSWYGKSLEIYDEGVKRAWQEGSIKAAEAGKEWPQNVKDNVIAGLGYDPWGNIIRPKRTEKWSSEIIKKLVTDGYTKNLDALISGAQIPDIENYLTTNLA